MGWAVWMVCIQQIQTLHWQFGFVNTLDTLRRVNEVHNDLIEPLKSDAKINVNDDNEGRRKRSD